MITFSDERKARKRHVCNDCRCTIEPDDVYVSTACVDAPSMYGGGHWSRFKRCADCVGWHRAFQTLYPWAYEVNDPYWPGILDISRTMTGEDWTALATGEAQ